MNVDFIDINGEPQGLHISDYKLLFISDTKIIQ